MSASFSGYGLLGTLSEPGTSGFANLPAPGSESCYRTIVADPPWAYDEGWPVGRPPKGVAHDGRRTPLGYEAMSIPELMELPIASLAATDAHLYLWTTNRYLRDAFNLLGEWGFRYAQTLCWCKSPMGIGPGGTWASNIEYVLFARRGSLRSLKRFPTSWFNWPRMGNAHSRKPEAFLDMVEEASPGPYLELFARRQRLGWDTWGDESLNHVGLTA